MSLFLYLHVYFFLGLKHYYTRIFGRKSSAQLAFENELWPNEDQTYNELKLYDIIKKECHAIFIMNDILEL